MGFVILGDFGKENNRCTVKTGPLERSQEILPHWEIVFKQYKRKSNRVRIWSYWKFLFKKKIIATKICFLKLISFCQPKTLLIKQKLRPFFLIQEYFYFLKIQFWAVQQLCLKYFFSFKYQTLNHWSFHYNRKLYPTTKIPVSSIIILVFFWPNSVFALLISVKTKLIS